MRTALIDSDILIYEVGVQGQYIDPYIDPDNNLVIKSFDHVKEVMDQKIAEITRRSESDCARIFLSGPNNFRKEIAKKKVYKDNRKDSVKPYHYENLRAYLISRYQAEVSDGIEADDLICIAQTEALAREEETIICSRDKDLRQCQGWHYTWECGAQPEKSPYFVKGFGELTPHYAKNGKMDRLYGTGNKWFLAQLLMGDSTDNIPGLKGWGPNKVYNLLGEVDDYKTGLAKVVEQYQGFYWDEDDYVDRWPRELIEQAKLVWMIRTTNLDGSPKHWSLHE